MTKKKETSALKVRGRKSLYKEEYAKQALKLSLLGATDIEMADFFGVSEQTFNSWKKKYPELFESIKRGKAVADSNVAAKLYNRAIGYEYDEKHEVREGGVVVEVKNIHKHMPSDTTAAIFWLKNRQPEKWRDRKEIDTSVTLNGDLESMTDEQLEQLISGEK